MSEKSSGSADPRDIGAMLESAYIACLHEARPKVRGALSLLRNLPESGDGDIEAAAELLRSCLADLCGIDELLDLAATRYSAERGAA